MWRINSNNELQQLAGPEGVVWVPSEQIIFYRADMPPKSKQVWEKTVPFVLEDKLLSPVEAMHFSIGQVEQEEGIPVACVSLELMQVWVGLLKEQGVKVRNFYPDFLAIPFDNEIKQPVFWQENDLCYLRYGLQQSISGSLEWVRSIAEIKAYGDTLRIFSDNPQSLPEDWKARAESLPQGLEETMVQVTSQSLPINIMQGSFRPTSVVFTWLKPWYWAAMALVVLASLFLADLQIKAYALDAQASTLRKITERTFLVYFPDEPIGGINVRTHLARLLNQLQDDRVERKTSAWQIMLAMEPILSSCAACKVEKIKLDAQVLKIEVSTSKDFAPVLSQIKKLSGVKFENESLSTSAERKKIRLVLESEEKT